MRIKIEDNGISFLDADARQKKIQLHLLELKRLGLVDILPDDGDVLMRFEQNCKYEHRFDMSYSASATPKIKKYKEGSSYDAV